MRRFTSAILVLMLVGFLIAGGLYLRGASNREPEKGTQVVVINEALRTLLYLPVYHAIERGYFRDEKLDVRLVTGGTATNAFSAMLNGEADIAVADPMYVPISRESGARTRVVGQVVARIAVWALSRRPNATAFDAATLKGRTISTHPRPMTAYTYTLNRLNELGLQEGTDIKVVQSRPGSEIAPFLAKRADFVVTLEPGASTAEAAGAHVIFSWPEALGDRIFTGLMVREDVLANRPYMVDGSLRAIQRAMVDIRVNRAAAITTAAKFFPGVDRAILERAVKRMLAEQVLPRSVRISQESWQSAVTARRASGDLKADAPFSVNVDSGAWDRALR